MNYKLSTIIEKDKYGYYAYCPELKGCQTQGETSEEAYANLKEAIELYIETMSKEELEEVLSKEIITRTYEVKVG